jgi:rhodanese-related sulfurtransferase
MRSAEDLVEDARRSIARVSAEQAFELAAAGALLVDIRPAAQRAAHGGVPGALIIERNVLEWRLDPAGEFRLPEVSDHARKVIVLCQQGYASSLAAASLAALGYTQPADVIGGFEAWAQAGLPVQISA